jgi:hypothetical protein
LPPEVYHDAGVWNREDFLVDQGITSTATVKIDRVERIGIAGVLRRWGGFLQAVF